MKQKFFKLSGVIFFLLFALNGCKKDNSTPDPVSKVVSPGKQITYFKIVSPASTGVIDTVNKKVSVTVPIGTVLTNLGTDISIAAGHTITPASGVAQNFSSPVVYTVKRPDNTTTTWTVSVGTAGVTIDQDITTSTTWTSDKTYFITGDITIGNNSVLTIQPGTVIKFNAGSSLTVGYASNATLIANGTASQPIIFTSAALVPAAGAWKGLYFTDTENLLKKTQENELMITRRESSVLKLLAEGFTNLEIAEKLFISPLTADSHRKNLIVKLQARNTASLIKIASDKGLI